MREQRGLPRNSVRRRLLLLSGCAGLAALLPPAGVAGAASRAGGLPATVEEARRRIRSAMEQHRMSAVSVAAVDGGRIVWQEGFGRIDRAGTVPGPRTLFAVGSISKVVAALAVMRLVDRGRVRLDDPLVRHLRGFRMASPGHERVTLRMLLAHSAGFPGTDSRGLFTTRPVAGYAEQVLQTLAGQRLKHAPGEMSVYCNDGFTLVEVLVAAVDGRPYARFVEEEVLVPLGMADSMFPRQPLAAGVFAPVLLGEAPEAAEYVNGQAAGGLYASAGDMARLALLFIGKGSVQGHRLFSEAAMRELCGAQTAYVDYHPLPAPELGLGWDGVRQQGLAAAGYRALHKNGQTIFYGSQLTVLPEQGLAVALTGTSPAYGPEDLAERILLHALAERAGAPRLAPSLKSPVDAGGAVRGEARAGRLERAVGVYAFNYGLLRVNPAEAGGLSLERYEQGAWRVLEPRLLPAGDGRWEGGEGRAYRLLSRAGRDYLVRRSPRAEGLHAVEELIAERVARAAPLSAAWRARLGRRWLCVNEDPDSILLEMAGPVFAVHGLEDVPGHVLAHYKGGVVQVARAATDLRAEMTIRLPGPAGANIDDVVFEPRGGEEWLRFGGLLHRPLEGLAVMGACRAALELPGEVHGTWVRLQGPTALRLSGASRWKLFDAGFRYLEGGAGDGRVQLVAGGEGAHLLAYGLPGRLLRLEPAGV